MCVDACVCMCVRYGLKIVSIDKILCFTNTCIFHGKNFQWKQSRRNCHRQNSQSEQSRKNTQGKNSQWEMFKNNNKSSHRKNSQSEYFFLNDKNQEPKKINVPSECWPSPCWHRQEHPHGPEGASVPAEWLRAAPSCGSWAVPPPPCLGAPCAERSGLWGEHPWNQPTSFRIAGLC